MNLMEREDLPRPWTSPARGSRGDGGEAGGPAPILAALAALIGIAAIAMAVLGGCTVDGEFAVAVDGFAAVILPEYRAYVTDDPALSADTKRIRLQTADRFEALIDAAIESAEADGSGAAAGDRPENEGEVWPW